MALLPLALAIGIVLGRLAGGRLGSLLELRLRWGFLGAVALAAQMALGIATARLHVPQATRDVLVVSSDLLVGLVLGRNVGGRPRGQQLGLCAFAAGWLANLLPIVAYGAMPVSRSALRRAGIAGIDVAAGHLGKHVLVAPRAAWLALGDWIPVRPLGAVVSPGDLFMLAGMAGFVAAAMCRPAACSHPAGAEDLRQETPRSLVPRLPEHLRRRPVLHDDPVLEVADAGRDLPGEVHLVSGDEHGHAGAC